MHFKRSIVENLIYGAPDTPRYTQDSPVLPDVWFGYGRRPGEPIDLLLTPHVDSGAGALAVCLRDRLTAERKGGRRGAADIAYTQSYVVARLYLDELVRLALPLTGWWRDYVWASTRQLSHSKNHQTPPLDRLAEPKLRVLMERALATFEQAEEAGVSQASEERRADLPIDLLWMMRIVGSLAWLADCQTRDLGKSSTEDLTELPEPSEMVDAIVELLGDLPEVSKDDPLLLWQVNLNRAAKTAVSRSSLAIKADAARLLFEVHCNKLSWAVVDSGIDARHPSFWHRLPPGQHDPRDEDDEDLELEHWAERTRVKETFDFTRVRVLLNPSRLARPQSLPEPVRKLLEEGPPERCKELRQQLKELKRRLLRGRSIDWQLLESFLRVPHDDAYLPPRSEHGTHVAGILAADWPQEGLQGICPDLNLYDLRVLDPQGENDEFTVLAALQFVDYLNAKKEFLSIHGANLSLAIHHEVANYACGRTPICEECERLVSSGVVVVAAAGNEGHQQYQTAKGLRDGYNTVSITDPGNAAGVITVGSTHRDQPHNYGVSYFSSRGPTGDGRLKPDLVAPGEKIVAPTPHRNRRRKDGTSMAAPHVSGAAAMLMARYSELIGEPQRIKKALCDTATDLGRERYFQGAGMLDVLRALQSI